MHTNIYPITFDSYQIHNKVKLNIGIKLIIHYPISKCNFFCIRKRILKIYQIEKLNSSKQLENKGYMSKVAYCFVYYCLLFLKIDHKQVRLSFFYRD